MQKSINQQYSFFSQFHLRPSNIPSAFLKLGMSKVTKSLKTPICFGIMTGIRDQFFFPSCRPKKRVGFPACCAKENHRDGIGIGRNGGPIGSGSPGFVDSPPFLFVCSQSHFWWGT